MSGGSMHSGLVRLVCLAIASAIGCFKCWKLQQHHVLDSEKHALLQFKQGLVDKSNALASWKSEKDCCKWRGIACDNQTGANFSGPVPPQLGNLSNLHTLDLSSNDFEGMMIPKFIGSLSQLKELKLADANFGGPVPPQLGNLSNLHTLDLYRNDGVSSENLECLAGIHVLDLSHNNISGGLPDCFNNITALANDTGVGEIVELMWKGIEREFPILWCLGLITQQLVRKNSIRHPTPGFNASAYMGNHGLCGPPLTPNCSPDGATQADDNKEHDNDGLISLGFLSVLCWDLSLDFGWSAAVYCLGFLEICLFQIPDNSKDWIYVKTAVYKAKVQRRLQR
ncbi:receptor-like protein EIX1 [Rosa chinensis]|uniref:receptor-like protein EIX1 n=1 Tax=Rosa chinensis TaxID=74649 RepID=UPI000D08E652|nr:receptor-like protein EIX1 [Rosa chinensis]